MFEHFLTSLLKIIIAIDVLGAIAYFVLGALRQKNRRSAPPLVEAGRPSLWERICGRRQPVPAPASDQDFDRLRRILYSYQEGLA